MNKRHLIGSPLQWGALSAFPVRLHTFLSLRNVVAPNSRRRCRSFLWIRESKIRSTSDRTQSGSGESNGQSWNWEDYSVEGMEHCCVVERKSLSDLVKSFTEQDRHVLRQRLRLMAEYPDSLLVVDAPMSQVKSRYEFSGVNPNQITQSVFAVMVGLRIQTIFAETHELGSEMVAWYLYNAHLYHWLEQNGFGRMIADDDL